MVDRVVAGLDLGPGSQRVLQEARSLADQLGCPLLAIHVLVPAWMMLPESALPCEPDLKLDGPKLAKARARMTEILDNNPGVEIQFLWGWPWRQLLRAAGPADWLVIGRQTGGRCWHTLFRDTLGFLTRRSQGRLVVVPYSVK